VPLSLRNAETRRSGPRTQPPKRLGGCAHSSFPADGPRVHPTARVIRDAHAWQVRSKAMPSQARLDLDARLGDVDELIKAHGLITGGGVGRPAQRQGAAVTRAGVVLLAAAMEGFVEDLYEEAAKILWPNVSAADRKALFDDTSRRLNNADVRKTELLYFNIGLPWVLGHIRWQKFPNATFKKSLDELVTKRNQIAHGNKQGTAQLGQLRRWKNMVTVYSSRLEAVVAGHIETVTGSAPNW